MVAVDGKGEVVAAAGFARVDGDEAEVVAGLDAVADGVVEGIADVYGAGGEAVREGVKDSPG